MQEERLSRQHILILGAIASLLPFWLATSATAQDRMGAPQALAVRGVSSDEIRFGFSGPLSGPSRDLGQQMRLGIEAAFRTENDDGGINGRMLRLIAADDGYEPSRTGDAMRQLYDRDQVFGFIGNVGTPTAAVAAPFALERRMLFFGALTGGGLLRRDPPDRYVFNYRASEAEETYAAVRYLIKVRKLKPEQIAVFAQQDSFGDSGYAGVEKAMRTLRSADSGPTLRVGYQRNTIDVDNAIVQLRYSRIPIKGVVMIATYRAAAKFIEKLRPGYPNMLFTNVSFVGSSSLRDELTLLGPKYAAGIIITQTVPPLDGKEALVLQYRAAMAKYFRGEAPDYVSLEGFVAAEILIDALRRAGQAVNTEKVVAALESLQNVELGLGTPIGFSRSEHQACHKVWATQLTETGKFDPVNLQ
jgi:branched-chain amino acid transport system substrate-binding protein